MKLTTKINSFAFLSSTSERTAIARGSASSFLIQVGFAALSFVSAAVLARWLGPENYGAYANAMAWVGFFAVVASFGFGSLLVRDVAILRSQSKLDDLKGYLKFTDAFVLGFSLFLVLIVLGMAQVFFYSSENNVMRESLIVASLLIPLSALAALKQSSIRGLEHITHSLFPDMIIRPILILTSVTLVFYFLPTGLNALTAIFINVVAAFITLCLSNFWLRGFLPPEIRRVLPKYKVKIWVKAAFPMFVFVGLQILISQTPTVMLGLGRSAKDVGLFAVANRVSTLLTFFIGAAQAVLGPLIARLYASGKKERLQSILTLTVHVAFILTLLLSLVFHFANDYILAIFGQEFVVAKVALDILMLGNLVDIASGSPALLLIMTGHERRVAIIYSIIALINISLNAFLISTNGFEGAALASAISLILSRLILAFYALNRLQINTTVFCSIRNWSFRDV